MALATRAMARSLPLVHCSSVRVRSRAVPTLAAFPSKLPSSASHGLLGTGVLPLKRSRIAATPAPTSRHSRVTVQAKCPIPPKSISYSLSALWLAGGFAYLFASHAASEFMYRGIVLPTTKLLCEQMGTGIIAIAGAMCGEAHQHSGPTATGLALMAIGLAIVCFKKKALMTSAGYTVCMGVNVVTAVYYLWKKYSEGEREGSERLSGR